MSGILYVVGTPIGNLQDITLRALETLKAVDVVACEDTRHTRILLERYGIAKRVVSYHKQNEREVTEKIIKMIEDGLSVALVTDAGMPCISDPGAVLVGEMRRLGYEIQSVPGPTAFATAMSISGIQSTSFAFIGFLPEKQKEKNEAIADIKNLKIPFILYCAPHDLEKTLDYLHAKLGEREVTVAKEITKLHETVYKGKLGSVEIENTKGEFVIIVEPAEQTQNEVDIVGELIEKINGGMSKSEAVKAVAAAHGLNKNDVYSASLTLK